MIPVPKELLWDYHEAPQDLLWRLQRIADFFPLYGKDRETVELLYRYRDETQIGRRDEGFDRRVSPCLGAYAVVSIADNPILTEEQKLLLEHFRGSLVAQDFYLTGGTALSAFFLHHRLSDDLDFFSEAPVGVEEVLALVKALPRVRDVQYERKYDRKLFILQFAGETPRMLFRGSKRDLS